MPENVKKAPVEKRESGTIRPTEQTICVPEFGRRGGRLKKVREMVLKIETNNTGVVIRCGDTDLFFGPDGNHISSNHQRDVRATRPE